MEIINRISLSIGIFPFNIILCVSLAARGKDETRTGRMFAMLAYVILAGNVLDIANTSILLSGIRYNVIISRLFASLTIGLGLLSSFFLLMYNLAYVEKERISARLMDFVDFFFMVFSAVLLVNLTTGWVFEVSAQGIPSQGPLYPFLVFFQRLFFTALTAVLVFLYRGFLNRRMFYIMITSLSVLFALIMLEYMVFSDYNLMFVTASLVLNVIFFGIETPSEERADTAEKTLSETLAQASLEREHAEETNRNKARFLADMSHAIRTPLTAILGMDEMIIRETDEEETRVKATDIKSAGNTLLYIINDILDFTRIESGAMEINPRSFYLGRTLRDVSSMIRVKTEEKGLLFETHLDKSLPDTLLGDDVRIKQIMINLLNNAVKYTQKGSVTLSVNGNISGDDIMLKIAVSDTGMGIRKEDLPKLFESFARFDEEKNKRVEGTGLGLAITSRLVSLMHGTIDVESDYGSGSTFTVHLPLSIIDHTPIYVFETGTAAVKTAYTPLFRAPDANILIVDDDEASLEVIKELLKGTGIIPDTAESGAECLSYIGHKKYDLILLDYRMPGMNGADTLNSIRALTDPKLSSIPVVVVTASALTGERERLLGMGFDGYLSKPVISSDLEKTILNLLPKEKIMIMGQKEAGHA